MSSEEALSKAREIAAKLTGAEEDSGPKRKRWGLTPDGNSPSEKKAKSFAAQQRLWISTKNKPASHFRLYWDQNSGMLSNQISNGEVQLTLKGRGSTKEAAPMGVPEEPLHLLIEGPSDERCDQASILLEQLFLEKAEHSALLEDDEPDAAPPATAPTASKGGYTPAPVAALIHNNGIPTGGQLLEEQIGVPNGVVGYIIGRGGESIASMQAKTQCKVQIQREHDMNPGQTERIITLQASSKEAIAACREIIENMVKERSHSSSSSVASTAVNSQDSKLQEALDAGHVLVKVQVPDSDVGLIIGKSGSTIKGVQDRSGANIQIPQQGDADNPSIRTVNITHPHAEGAKLAKQLIEDILGSKKNHVPHITLQVEIPDKDVGMCIGRSGCVIREMQNLSGTRIQIPSFSTPGQPTRIATVVGPADGCNRVKQMIERIVLEQSSQSVMSGDDPYAQGGYGGYGQHAQQGGYGGYGGQQGSQGGYGGYQQQQQQQRGGQKDYSAEWAAYYAAQGKDAQRYYNNAQLGSQTSATAAISQSAGTSSATTVSSGTTDSTYYEQFFRYAYYYGEEAARKYYGAWSPPVGTPNPYGTNPNGVTSAPATGASQASVAAGPTTSAQAPAQALAQAPANSDVRETGRRGVSNLPAWMTQGN